MYEGKYLSYACKNENKNKHEVCRSVKPQNPTKNTLQCLAEVFRYCTIVPIDSLMVHELRSLIGGLCSRGLAGQLTERV